MKMQRSKSMQARTAINTDTRTTRARLVSCRGILIRDVIGSQRFLFPPLSVGRAVIEFNCPG